MFTLYKVHIRPEADSGGGHITATFSPYNIQVDADTEAHVVYLIRDLIITEAIKRKDFESVSLDDIGEGSFVYLYIDIEREFKFRHNGTVRKNISLPEWMDMQLRDPEVDASKLFQNAAQEYIWKSSQKGTLINNVEELIKMVPKEILDEYIMQRLKGETK